MDLLKRLFVVAAIAMAIIGCHKPTSTEHQQARQQKLGAPTPNPTNNPYLNVSDWYFGPTCSNGNAGTDAGHALCTHSELLSRLGPQPLNFGAFPVTLHYAAGTSMADTLTLQCSAGLSTSLNLEGTPTVSATGTLSSSLENMNRSEGLFPVADLPTWSGNPLFLDTTANATAWLLHTVATGPYTGWTEMTSLLTHQSGCIYPDSCVTNPAEKTMTAGDSYELLTLPVLNSVQIGGGCAVWADHVAISTFTVDPYIGMNVNESAVGAMADQSPWNNNLNGNAASYATTILNSRYIGSTNQVTNNPIITGGDVGAGQFHGNFQIDGDAILDNNSFFAEGRGCYGAFASHHQMSILPSAMLVPDVFCGIDNGYVANGSETFWAELQGDPTIDLEQQVLVSGEWIYSPPATQAFQGPQEPVFQIDTNANSVLNIASTRDLTIHPSPTFDNLTLTRENLDTAVSSGGFGGYAFREGNFAATLVSTSVITSSTNLGGCFGVVAGLDAGTATGCIVPDAGGQVLTFTGTGFAWTTVNTDAGISFPISVPNGGTGDTTFSVGSVLLGDGTSALSTAAPGTSGDPLVSNGAATNPSFQSLNLAGAGVTGTLPIGNGGTGLNTVCASGDTLLSNGSAYTCGIPDAGISFPISVPNGGTDDTSLTAHGVLLGEGTSAVSAVAPSASAYPLVSNASADPSYQALNLASAVTGVLGISNGGTGLNAVCASGESLVSDGGVYGCGLPTTSQVTVVTTSGTVTSPSWANHALLQGWGGGGGGASGGGPGSGDGTGGAGGGGAFSYIQLASVTPSTVISVTIGAGGAGATGAGSSGGVGGNTTFNSIQVFRGASGGAGFSSMSTSISALPGGAYFTQNGDFTPMGAFSTISIPGLSPTGINGYVFGPASGGATAENTDSQGASGNVNPSYGSATGGVGGAGVSGTSGGGGGGAGPGGNGGNGGNSSTTSPTAGGSAAANSGAGGGGGGANSNSITGANGGNGGSGELIILWLP